MILLSPAWLWLIVPWAAVAMRLLRARGRDQAVPFVALWREAKVDQPMRRGWRLPPVHVVLVLLAMLSAIVAASRPAIRGLGAPPPLTLIWDRGFDAAGRYGDLAEALPAALRKTAGWGGRVNLQPVPGDGVIHTDMSDLTGILPRLSSTALDTRADIMAAARAALRQSDQPVIVVSAHPIDLDDPRLVVIHPPHQPHNLSITHLAMRTSPVGQVMVRVRSEATQGTTAVGLRLGFDEQVREEMIDVDAGQTRTVFMDAPVGASVVSAELLSDDEVMLDNRAWVVRRGRWPRIELAEAQPSAIQRMVAVYADRRRADARAPTVMISRDPLPEGMAGVVVAGADGAARVTERLAVGAHPVLEGVGLEMVEEIRAGKMVAPEGFAVILRAGDLPLMAVRDQPARQVWMGLDTTAFADQPAFVVLWASALQWVGGEGTRYTSELPQTLGGNWVRTHPGPLPADVAPGWAPGVYQDADGARVAINAVASDAGGADAGGADAGDWRAALDGLALERRGALDVSAGWMVGALVLGVAAAATWPAVGLTRPYKRRTVPT